MLRRKTLGKVTVNIALIREAPIEKNNTYIYIQGESKKSAFYVFVNISAHT